MFNDEAQPGDLNMNCEFIGGIRVGVGFREGGLGGGGGGVDVKRSEWETRQNSRNEKVSHDKSDLSERL